jgi:DNA polymerase III delta prime subunit
MTETKPLTEKYRPKTLSDVVGQEDTISTLKTWVERFKDKTFQFPNMLFYGPPGTGKTSAAKAFVNDLFGGAAGSSVLELNASMDRTLSIIRGRVKDFAGTASMYGINIIVMDEADNLAHDTQPALRRVMEQYNTSTRFILIANDIEGIIEPLQSRCAKFHFNKLNIEKLSGYMNKIALSEGLNIEQDAMSRILELADGKPRDLLQILSILSTQPIINRESIEKIAKSYGVAKWESLYRSIFTNPLASDIILIDLLEKDGIKPNDILEGIFELLVKDNSENIMKIKPAILTKLAEYDFRLAMRGSPKLQLRCLCWSIYYAARKV